ncbi:hypothetical protein H7100_03705 [Candidatus Saccharibacteria bacterium]|nr:hypothetical protein [Candidatus Saccharibacteria bacterium]
MLEEQPPTPQSTEPLKLVILDQSKDALDAARDEADARLVEELSDGNGLKKFLNGIWKGNIAKEFYRQKYINNALGQIEDSQNILTHNTDLSVASRSRAIDATIQRFQTEHDEMIHTDAGEKRETLDDTSEIADAFKAMIRNYAEGHLNDTTLREERTRFMQAYRENHGDEAFGKGLVTTDNMMEIARSVMGAVEHGESIDHVMAQMQVITGETRAGVRTEASYNRVDKVIDKITKTKIGSIIGPEAVMTAVTVAAIATKWGSHSVLGAALKTVAPGAGAGLWAGLRENKRVKDERSQHSRETAMGKTFDQQSTRRQEMETARYESVAANSLTETIRSTGNLELLETGNEAVRAALDSLAQVQSRIDLSNRRNIDLISYSDAASIGDERMELDLARAEVRVALESKLTPEVRAELGLDASQSVRELIGEQSEKYIDLLDVDISAKDRAFKTLKAKRVAKSVAIGVATGLIGGALLQEGIASLDPTRAGLIEKAWGAENVVSADGLQHQTLLEGIVEGQDRVIHTDHSNVFDTYATAENGNGSLSLSDDHTLVENGDGTVNFVDQNGHDTIKNLVVNPDGSLPQDSLDRLQAAGMQVEDHSFDKDVIVTTQEQVSSDQYVQNHLSETTKVQRDLWYGNDTPGVYDQNELRVYWGGQGGLVDGGYQLSAAGMQPGGSYEGGQSVDWNQAAANGNLFMSISASVDTQTQTFMVPIGPDGAITIGADSPAGHFFANVDGHAQFTGAYAEVVQTTGVDAEGVVHTRPLATLVGEGGQNPVIDTVTTTTTEHHAVYSITTEGYDTTIQNFTEAAPGVPIESRRSLEAPISRRAEYYYQGGEALTSAERKQRREETSPRLLESPDADLNAGEELKWYRRTLERKRGKEYVQSIDQVIQTTPELAGIDSKTKVIVQVPVNAAGEAEANGIYNLITTGYGGQDSEALDKTVILMHVNWFDTYEGDDTAVRANIAKTHAEIERARADRPDIHIAIIESEWKRDQVRDGVIGHVSRKMHDAALLALDKANSEGRLESTDDVLLIRNDSDPKGISGNYLKNYVKSFTTDNEPDIFTGVTTFDNTKADRLPGLVYAANFMQSLDLLNSARHGSVHTGGANFGIKASTLAAIGGTGMSDDYNGAGSDDVAIGRRVKSAREGKLSTSRSGLRSYVRGEYSLQTNGGSTTSRRIAKKISARIDTDSDRQEALYIKGVPIIYSWNEEHNFDKDGYQARDAELQTDNKLVSKESLQSDPGLVIERIRNDMEASIRVYGSSRALIVSALEFAFMGIGSNGYELGTLNGHITFGFTEEGKKYLLNQLSRDVKGRFDSYGARKKRQLYGQVKPEAKRQSDRQSLFTI